MCYSFDDVIEIEDFYFDNILLDKTSSKNIMVYDFIQGFGWCKTKCNVIVCNFGILKHFAPWDIFWSGFVIHKNN